MKTRTKALIAIPVAALTLSTAIWSAYAQVPPAPYGTPPAPPPDVNTAYAAPGPAVPAFSQQELDSMLAPIALYPDSLLSQILMAATYPLEVIQADRWVKANPGLTGDAAVRAAQNQNWDPSVISLVAFPQVLDMMDQKLDWTQRLGDAFLGQQAQVMDTVQGLRARAYQAGNLRSNQYLSVQQSGPTYIVQPAQPQVVYVPYYDPNVVYGAWAYPAYPPVYYPPPPRYYNPPPRASVSIGFGNGVSLAVGFFFGSMDWGHRRAAVVDTRPYYYQNVVRRETTIINNNTTIINNNGGARPAAHRRCC